MMLPHYLRFALPVHILPQRIALPCFYRLLLPEYTLCIRHALCCHRHRVWGRVLKRPLAGGVMRPTILFIKNLVFEAFLSPILLCLFSSWLLPRPFAPSPSPQKSQPLTQLPSHSNLHSYYHRQSKTTVFHHAPHIYPSARHSDRYPLRPHQRRCPHATEHSALGFIKRRSKICAACQSRETD